MKYKLPHHPGREKEKYKSGRQEEATRLFARGWSVPTMKFADAMRIRRHKNVEFWVLGLRFVTFLFEFFSLELFLWS
jgi:hypothetical protein